MKPKRRTTREKVSPTGSMRTRSAESTRGVVRGLDREDHVVLVQHLVVLEAVHERGRREIGRAGEKHGRARHARRRLSSRACCTRWSSGISWRRVFSNSSRLPRRHVYITTITAAASTSGTQPPSCTLSRLAPRKVRSMSRNGVISAAAASARPVPHLPDHDEGHDAGDHHGAGHGDAVGGGQRARRAEHQHQQQHADEQDEVDPRHVDLAVVRFRGVADLEPRQQPELDRLLAERIGAGDDGLARDHGRRRSPGPPSAAAPSPDKAERTGSRSPWDRRARARPGRDN